MSEPIRLSKRLIELVGCSRREAELFIEGGWVTVDGEVIDEPQFKVDNQKVELDPEAKATAPEPVTILLNAPAGLDTDSAMALIGPDTLSEEHRFGKRPLKGHFLRLSVGNELQANASGLLVFTQDWKIVRKLTADASKIEHDLGWVPEETFETGLRKTVQWYLDNLDWCRRVQDGSYQGERLGNTEPKDLIA